MAIGAVAAVVVIFLLQWLTSPAPTLDPGLTERDSVLRNAQRVLLPTSYWNWKTESLDDQLAAAKAEFESKQAAYIAQAREQRAAIEAVRAKGASAEERAARKATLAENREKTTKLRDAARESELMVRALVKRTRQASQALNEARW
ncbi:hypothetical protein MAIT1_01533 [Magnetofaba australis IT-1]|uniref:Uncharacterized protein n=2 Tax=Magnetofaba TaxID=1472292 RepID=A0A1Y2K0J1_9PROT|nr:hypothetical protein MAIT1_01533 [Magnetofaba australis IT-1]